MHSLSKLLTNRLLITLLCFAALTCSTKADSNRAVIALFGDSLTVGFIPDGYPGATGESIRIGGGTTTRGVPTTHLSNLLNNSGVRRPSIVTNWGYGGTSTSIGSGNGLARISNNLAEAASLFDGSQYFVLIFYGTNDFNYGIDPNTTATNIRAMIDRARAAGFDPIVGTAIPRSDYDVAPYNNQIKAAAQVRNAFLVDHYSVFRNTPNNGFDLLTEELNEYNQTVRLHPLIEGYELIASNWFNARLKDVIASSGLAIPLAAITLLLEEDPVPPPPPPPPLISSE